MMHAAPWLVITFRTATTAMAVEKLCAQHSLPGRLIPTPRQLSASCGMAWRAPLTARAGLAAAFKSAGIEAEGWHELVL